MPAPTDPAPAGERHAGRHSAPRTPLHRRPAVVAAAAAVVLLGIVAGGALALRQPADGALAGASTSSSTGGSSTSSGAVPPGSPGSSDVATTLAAPVTTSAPPSPSRPTATAASAEAVRELEANPRISLSSRARQALARDPVDLRLATLLVQLSAQQPLSVAELPAAAAGAGGDPVRAVVLDGLAGQPVGADPEVLAALQRQLAAQDPAYRAEASQQQDGDTTTLRVTLPPVTG